jgi:hypothetical protein
MFQLSISDRGAFPELGVCLEVICIISAVFHVQSTFMGSNPENWVQPTLNECFALKSQLNGMSPVREATIRPRGMLTSAVTGQRPKYPSKEKFNDKRVHGWTSLDRWARLALCGGFLNDEDPEGRDLAADTIGYLLGYAHLTNTRSLALIGDPSEMAYEILFSFSSPAEKKKFLDLVRSNDDLGGEYIDNDLLQPVKDEIRNARPLAAELPQTALTRALIGCNYCLQL